ncbi:MAG: zinc ribbon domain-containing protein [Methanobrevibacter sp.]|uniref:PsbP-related protein n=1 Tax=Methanobrevibacter sp. TaxID=66852 RepID=UPI0025D6391B|nr:zinc ribbon domain-containing protein [Methanobrevibacter sp.]MBQ6098881.1 zinc ribbon domain-containing protein [Methanobrevibacter sp.]
MKKCPECGNPSYDGAPVCGNCGYKFPKPKVAVRKRESIFEQNPEQIQEEKPKVKKTSNEPSTIEIIKEKKLIIGAILLVTLIVICGIFLTGSNNNNGPTIQTGDIVEYNAGDFAFKYPASWQKVNLTDSDHETAIFFKNENNTIIEHYNITSSASSLKDINQNRISLAIDNGDALELLETITLDGRNASNIILENADGNYTRYVSMFTDGKLYVFKVSGDSINSITSDSINGVINSADIK